jgi:hypothetical protein
MDICIRVLFDRTIRQLSDIAARLGYQVEVQSNNPYVSTSRYVHRVSQRFVSRHVNNAICTIVQ